MKKNADNNQRSLARLSRRELMRAGVGAVAGYGLFPGGKGLSLPAKERTERQKAETGEEFHRRLDHFQVVGRVGDAPIYAFGKTFVHGVSPDFELDVVLQEGNKKPKVKIRPKKSWEITENGIGVTDSIMPSTPRNDIQFLLCSNLIDGNRETSWCSRGQAQPDVEPVWIRIDLAREERVREIVLVPRQDGQGIPAELTIKVSRDAWHWRTIYETDQQPAPKAGEPLRFPLTNPTPVKQVWIIGNNCPNVNLTAKDSVAHMNSFQEPMFALAEVEVITEAGENVALISRGAGVTVSSTNYGHNSTWEMVQMLWPVHYDLGLKWIRMNNWGGPLEWDFVEQEKGKYVIDRWADEAIREAADNRCQVILNLSYGNWLYAAQPRKNFANHIWQELYDWPPHPVTPEMQEGYKNYVRTMVRNFKDRVHWYEVYNEPFYGMESKEAEAWKLYCELFKEVAPVIREEDPKAKISVAGDGNPIRSPALEMVLKYLGRDGMKYVDAFGFHIQGSTYPLLKEYPNHVKRFRSDAEALGFRGILMATEYWIGVPYPPVDRSTHYSEGMHTEICKAKETARVFLMNRGLSVLAFWCDTWKDQMQGGNGLFRNTFSADPIPPQQPEPVYYAIRTLCTIMDGANPTELKVEFSNKSQEFDNYNFTLPEKGILVGLCLPGESQDRHPGVKTDLVLKGIKASKVVGIDTLNGFEQELEFRQEGEGVVVPNILVRDYPLMIKIARA